MVNTKGAKYKEEDLDKRLSHLEKAFKGLVQRLYRVGIIRDENEEGRDEKRNNG